MRIRHGFSIVWLGGALAASIFVLPSAEGQPHPEVATVSGRVVNAKTKQPIAGVIVALRVRGSDGSFTRILPIAGMNASPTNAQGEFAFTNIPEGEYQLTTQIAGYHPFTQTIAVSAEKPPVLEAPLMPVNAFIGTVFKPDGTPAAKVPAYVNYHWGGSPTRTSFQTDAEGHYRMGFTAAAPHKLRIRVPNVGSVLAEATTKENEDAPLDIKLGAFASISGLLQDKQSGKPLAAGNLIKLQPVGEPNSAAALPVYPEISARTDAQGRFRVPEVPAGAWTVHPQEKHLLTYSPTKVELQAGQKQDDVVIETTAAPVVSSQIIGLNGHPMATAQTAMLEIWKRQGDGKCSVQAEQVTVDAQGRFTANVPLVGDVQFFCFVEVEGYAATDWMKLEEGKEVSLEIRLRPYLRLAGEVLQKGAEKRVPGAVVKAAPVLVDNPGGGRPKDVMCNNRGRFLLEGMIPGSYELSAVAEGVASTQPVRVTLEASGNNVPDETEAVIEVERIPPAAQ